MFEITYKIEINGIPAESNIMDSIAQIEIEEKPKHDDIHIGRCSVG